MKTIAISTKNDRMTKSTVGTLIGTHLCAAGVREGISSPAVGTERRVSNNF